VRAVVHGPKDRWSERRRSKRYYTDTDRAKEDGRTAGDSGTGRPHKRLGLGQPPRTSHPGTGASDGRPVSAKEAARPGDTPDLVFMALTQGAEDEEQVRALVHGPKESWSKRRRSKRYYTYTDPAQ